MVTPQSVVANGIASLIGGRHGDLMITTEGQFGEQPDVVFYDVIGLHNGDGQRPGPRGSANTDAVIVAVTHEAPAGPRAGRAGPRGPCGRLDSRASAEDFSRSSTRRISGRLDTSSVVRAAHQGTRLGVEVGLTHREADILGRIVRGMSNRDIAEECVLSINSVKSYIRSAYRKMDVRESHPGGRVGRAARLPPRRRALSPGRKFHPSAFLDASAIRPHHGSGHQRGQASN